MAERFSLLTTLKREDQEEVMEVLLSRLDNCL
jgi:hypothetical protein